MALRGRCSYLVGFCRRSGFLGLLTGKGKFLSNRLYIHVSPSKGTVDLTANTNLNACMALDKGMDQQSFAYQRLKTCSGLLCVGKLVLCQAPRRTLPVGRALPRRRTPRASQNFATSRPRGLLLTVPWLND